MKRPSVIRLAPDAAEVIRTRKARAAMLNRVSAALAPLLAEERDRQTLGNVVIEFGSGIVARATDGAGAASALGRAAGQVSPFVPPCPGRAAAERAFRGGRG